MSKKPSNELKKTKGGKRPGAGMPKGYITAKTRSKIEAREALREIVTREMEAMTAAQIHAAKGIAHFILRDPKTGKFERVTDADKIVAALNASEAEEGSTFYIHTKDPSIQAYTDLMNRALDKPKEQEQEIKITGEADLISKLLAGRKRAAEQRTPHAG